jgi:FkbM family methyltransferase
MRHLTSLLWDYASWYGPLRWPLYVSSRVVGWPETVGVRHRRLAHPLLMRPRSTDVPMYHSIFTMPQYDVPLLREPQIIFDCGGNVGYAAVWFGSRYPRAQIFSIEPARENYALLLKNISFYTNIVPIHAAIWGHDTSLDVVDIGQGSCSFETHEAAHAEEHVVIGRSLAFSVPTLMKLLAVDRIDFLKIDIEGAEQQLFDGDLGWLKCIGVIAIEFHDERCPDLRARVAEIAPQFFEYEGQLGENVCYGRIPFVDGTLPRGLWSRL